MTWGNHYLRVVVPTDAYLLVAIYPSNTYVGSSQAYGNVYEKVVLQPGDEIHKLVGGTFIHHKGRWWQGRRRLSEKHLFEKTYGAPPDFSDWPPEEAVEIEDHTIARVPPAVPTTTAEWAYAHGQAYGRSDDYVIMTEVES